MSSTSDDGQRRLGTAPNMAAMTSSDPARLPRPFRHLAGANLAAQSAEQISLAAVPIVAVLALGAGPGEIGLLAAAQTLPFLLLSIPLGLLADRRSRRGLMLLCEGLRALSLLGLVGAALLGAVSLPLLALLGFVGAAGTVGFTIAAPALVPALVPRAQFAAANGRLELARSAAYAGGPALAGALVAWAGASPAFVLAAVLSVAAVALLARVPEPAQTPAAPRHPLAEIRDGARFVWHQPLLKPMLLAALVWNLSWFVLQAAYVPYAVRALGLSAAAVGTTLAAYGVGMVVGALASPRLLRGLSFGHAVTLGPVVSVLAMVLMVATLAVPSATLATLAFFCFGAGPIVWTISTTTLRQALTPPAMLGRVGAIFLTVNAGARPVGAAMGGAVGAAFGEAACLWLALAGFVLQAALIVGSALRPLQRLPAQAAAEAV
jgi:predicted MFS family arabinose efflux permease